MPIAIYLAANAGRSVRARLGRGDVDRHSICPRDARPRGPSLPDPPAGLHAHRRGRRRHRLADRHRGRLLRRTSRRSALRSRSGSSRCSSLSERAGVRHGIVYARSGSLVGRTFTSGVDPVVVGLAIGLLTLRHPAARTDLERASDLFRDLSRTADARARAFRRHRPDHRDLTERAAAAALPSLDELRDRAAVRPRQRRDCINGGFFRAPSPGRSRSGSCSATSSASRSGSSAPHGSSPG